MANLGADAGAARLLAPLPPPGDGGCDGASSRGSSSNNNSNSSSSSSSSSSNRPAVPPPRDLQLVSPLTPRLVRRALAEAEQLVLEGEPLGTRDARVLLHGCRGAGLWREALVLVRQVAVPSSDMLRLAMRACAEAGRADEALEVQHRAALHWGRGDARATRVCNELLRALSMAGRPADALRLLRAMTAAGGASAPDAASFDFVLGGVVWAARGGSGVAPQTLPTYRFWCHGSVRRASRSRSRSSKSS